MLAHLWVAFLICEHGDRTISRTGDGGKGLSIASAPYSPNYQEDDILSKPSASLLHQIKQIHELGLRRFVGRSLKWFVVNGHNRSLWFPYRQRSHE